MNKRAGFSLLLFITYLVICTLIITLTLRWSLLVITKMVQLNNYSLKILDVQMIHDLLIKDIHCASPHKNDWHITHSSEVAFKTRDGLTIKWHFNDGKAVRTQEGDGNHNYLKKSCLAEGIVRSEFVMTADGNRVKKISFTLATADYVLPGTVSLSGGT